MPRIFRLYWKYKSNVNFIRYCKDEEVVSLDSLCKSVFAYSDILKTELRVIIKVNLNAGKNKADLEAIQMPIGFFLGEQKTKDTLSELIGLDFYNVPNDTIILLKDMAMAINAIDSRLELREEIIWTN